MSKRCRGFAAGAVATLALAAGLLAGAAEKTPPTAGAAAESPAPKEARLRWWREARFGLFVHWGPVSLKGTEIGWSRKGERRDRAGTGTIPAEVYDTLYKQFNPTKFDADRWVAVARAAGMKYLVLTAKHHDGFCLFDSKLTEYKITNAPFKRDVCAELARACRKAGIRLGFYYSPPDWHHPDFFTARHDRYVEYMHGQVRELLTNYAPDILWFDHDGGTNRPETWDTARLFPMIRKLAPQLILTKRCAGIGDFDTPEQRVGQFQRQPWETCMTIGRQWSWKPDDRIKTLRECLHTLISCAGGDGNLLFNVGPMPTGEIEPRQVERLQAMGAWLGKYGQTIYATRGGPFKPANGVVGTCRGKTVYVHVLRWSGDEVRVPALPGKVLTHRVLTGGKAQLTQDAAGIRLAMPAKERDPIDTIIQLDLDTVAVPESAAK